MSLLENKSPALRKAVNIILITYDVVINPTEWGNLVYEYGYISMKILQRESHKCFSGPVANVDPFTADPFTVMTLDPANVDADKKLFYSPVDSQVVA